MFLFFKYIFKDSDVGKLGRIFPVYSKKDTLYPLAYLINNLYRAACIIRVSVKKIYLFERSEL